MLKNLQRGDTLIEVLFGITVFSFVIVGALTIMNQGSAAAQRSLEISLVRQQIYAQAEALRFAHDSYVAIYQQGISFNVSDATTSPAEEWYQMATSGFSATEPSPFSAPVSCPTPPPGSFIMDTRTVAFVAGTPATLQASETFAQVAYQDDGRFIAAQGLWIEPLRFGNVSQPEAGYIDFHIRACWEGPGISTPMTTGTIVRLYEPRG